MARWLKVAAAAAVLCVFAWASAGAAEGKGRGKGDRQPPDPAKIFQKLDKDGNGKVTEKEFLDSPMAKDQEKAKARFKKLDANSDGEITLDEFKAGHAKRGEGGRRGGKK